MRGYLTQCVGPNLSGWGFVCDNTAKLTKPAKWRCPECVKRYGPLPEVTDDP